MATIAGLSITTPRFVAKAPEYRPKTRFPGSVRAMRFGSNRMEPGRLVFTRPIVRAAPDGISEKVEKSIEEAKETCADDPTSGECVAAWDEVEELSAAASHARDKKKAGGSDPLDTYCKDNPETDECRTYDN